ncbi:excinuclease ABC subunit UvrC [Dongia sedimenti]|uniref:UvrABC system protein C n=1 Tax=Dongia sedimenti TaxID=3064282 RepID=A0ABU0YVT9_9PROT|nr:excinuclease ABC subunit UvrC [Rhodospirillaceae bacterium R-7]
MSDDWTDTETPEDLGEASPSRGGRGRLAHGAGVIREKVKTLPNSPGVYRMMNAKGDVLYVGKARDLKKRVTAYTQPYRQGNRIQRMISETTSMEFVTTHTEVEALLLEANLIKRYMPRYNVLLRDDKSFPYILITGDHPAPQLAKHRGARNRPGEYFGPFASAGAVNRTIVALQRAFLLRPCSDSIFASRTRPCLQFQIKRCSAPCVGRITEADYQGLVQEAHDFLTGKSDAVKLRMSAEMQQASDALEFEKAARLRDRIQALAAIQSRQDINLENVEEADIIAAHQEESGHSCVQVFFFRNHSNYGSRAYFPAHDRQAEIKDILAAFIGQFYENKTPPKLILVNETPAEAPLLAEAMTLRAGRKVEILAPQRGDKRKALEHALLNAKDALTRRMAESASQTRLLAALAELFRMEQPPKRIEVYDNSHISGTNPYGAMIVAGPEGFMKNQYRKYSIRDVTRKEDEEAEPEAPAGLGEAPVPAFEVEPNASLGEVIAGANALRPQVTAGDDYAMMRQVLTRRFNRALKEDPDRDKGLWPDLVLIDGGAGQLSVSMQVLADLGITDVCLASIAKGPDRNAGRERFFMPGREPFSLDPKSPVLYFLQRLRDEAHRFVIGAHRAKRSKEIRHSILDDVPGIGAKRKKALLLHFGSARAVSQAGLSDLSAVPGVSEAVARKIYDHFHGG